MSQFILQARHGATRAISAGNDGLVISLPKQGRAVAFCRHQVSLRYFLFVSYCPVIEDVGVVKTRGGFVGRCSMSSTRVRAKATADEVTGTSAGGRFIGALITTACSSRVGACPPARLLRWVWVP